MKKLPAASAEAVKKRPAASAEATKKRPATLATAVKKRPAIAIKVSLANFSGGPVLDLDVEATARVQELQRRAQDLSGRRAKLVLAGRILAPTHDALFMLFGTTTDALFVLL